MKILTAFLVLLYCSSQLMAQRLDSASIKKLPPAKQEEVYGYIQQSNNARATAIILCITGGSMVLAGAVLSVVYDVNHNNDYNDPYNTYHLNGGGWVMIAGFGVGLCSIPFFLKIHQKRNEARALMYVDHGAFISPGVRMPGTQSAGIKWVIPLGK